MTNSHIPDSTAVRTALWRALHVELDSKPHIIEDTIGLKLVAPDANWRERPDMHPIGTKTYRASIVGRARYIEDLVTEKANVGVNQYVILGAGLDSFVQRRPEIASLIQTFEIDKHATQEWKKQRLTELKFGTPSYLKFVPVDFESGESWWDQLKANGFDEKSPAVVASTGVAMYLSKEAVMDKLKKVAKMASGTTLAMSFLLPLEMIEEDERKQLLAVKARAEAAGTPFMSFYSPDEILSMAKEAGFSNAKQFSIADLDYFDRRADELRSSRGESMLVASV